jgi:crotonobetainyl-CoA:carnitine CoA-transferase CaiB-like acyl-CoA transferase
MLGNLVVLEYASLVSGPYCARLLADLGAEVIKIEHPQSGDESRQRGPFPQDNPDPEKSGLFLCLNNNKLGITLDIKTEAGAKLFRELLERADVLVENQPVGCMEALGFGYQNVREINPRLVMTSVTSFGQTGPYSRYKASELTLFHMSGVGYGTPGRVQDPELEMPLKPRATQLEFLAGMAGAVATMLAIVARHATGKGQHVDVSALEAGALVNWGNAAQYFYTGQNASRLKEAQSPTAPLHILPCKNGYVNLECVEEDQWWRLVELMGNPEWASNELFKDGPSRAKYWDGLEPLLCEFTTQWGKEELSAACQEKRIACTPVSTAADLFSFEHLRERGFFVKVDHPVMGKVECPGAPFQTETAPRQIRRPAPRLGEDNEAVFCQRLGRTTADLIEMRESHVI